MLGNEMPRLCCYTPLNAPGDKYALASGHGGQLCGPAGQLLPDHLMRGYRRVLVGSRSASVRRTRTPCGRAGRRTRGRSGGGSRRRERMHGPLLELDNKHTLKLARNEGVYCETIQVGEIWARASNASAATSRRTHSRFSRVCRSRSWWSMVRRSWRACAGRMVRWRLRILAMVGV